MTIELIFRRKRTGREEEAEGPSARSGKGLRFLRKGCAK